MAYYFVKVIISALIIVLVSELAKAYSWVAALITSLPLISILALSWLYIDTHDIQKVSDLAVGIFWLVIPSLVFFIALPFLLAKHVPFWMSLGISCVITALFYSGYFLLLSKIGVISS